MSNKSVYKDWSSVKGGGLPVVCEGDVDGGGMVGTCSVNGNL